MDKTLLLTGVELAVWNDWELGFDTFDISRRLGLSEAVICRALIAARQKMRHGHYDRTSKPSLTPA